MHILDRYIIDIEPRIEAICNAIPKQEEPSLQEALAAYGWVLLDSWVAWRTLRFLLRETEIDEKTQEKWFQTPSSYTASQLKAAWGLETETLQYLEEHTGKSFKELIDKTIQKNRNSCAHFSKATAVRGTDSTSIKLYFTVLSKVFLLQETSCFLSEVHSRLSCLGYTSFEIEFSDGAKIPAEELTRNADAYALSSQFSFHCKNKEDEICTLFFDADGCKTIVERVNSTASIEEVANETHAQYRFLQNKGFYLSVGLFVDTVVGNWNTPDGTLAQPEQALAIAR